MNLILPFQKFNKKNGHTFKFNRYYTLFASASENQGSVYLSEDGGNRWAYGQVMYPEALSDVELSKLGANRGGALLGVPQDNGVTFVRFPIKWVFLNKQEP